MLQVPSRIVYLSALRAQLFGTVIEKTDQDADLSVQKYNGYFSIKQLRLTCKII